MTPQQRGGVITESMQKQMGGPEGIDQFELPRAVVTRVAKAEVSAASQRAKGIDLEEKRRSEADILTSSPEQLPDSVQIRKDAILAVSKSATIFISYLGEHHSHLLKGI